MKKIFIVLSTAALLLSSCGRSENASEQSQIPQKRTLTAQTQICMVPITNPAQIRGKEDISILPQVEGTLEQVLVAEGQKVRKGQKMFVIDATAYQAAVDNAAAAVNVARTNVETYELEAEATKQLFEKGVVAEHQYKVDNNRLQVARAQLAEAEAALTHARNDLNHTVVCSPHDGVVGTITYRQGSLVGPGIPQPLTVVSDNSTVYAYVSMNSDNYLEMVREAGGKEQLLASIPEAELILGNDVVYGYKGKVETISGVIDSFTGAVSVRVAFPNPEGILTAGGSGSVRTEWEYQGIVIPRSATYELQDKHFVYVVEKADDGTFKAVSQEITVYRLNDSEYIVVSGLSDGDRIVTEGVSKMTNGMQIEPKD